MEKQMQDEREPTACCGYIAPEPSPYPVMWNPWNKVVQCHNCGETYAPRTTASGVMASDEPLRWEFTGIAGLKRFLTQKQYEAQTPGTQEWYRPICPTENG
jgi:hypothetical protein